jgi:alpha-1,2-rhamnosyltransferase
VVGSLVPHKNIKAVLEAFDLLLNSHYDDTYLLFAGNKGWDLETDQLIESHKMYGETIHILGSVTDVQLNLLYKHCYCLVQASFYEGFGLPVVEALQNYKPVIASTGGSLREVGGDFCIYFDPTKPVELYQSLEKLLYSDSYYNQLVARIKSEYRAFSWKECAEQFLSHLLN